jgi:uncharacterized membrane protein YgcG
VKRVVGTLLGLAVIAAVLCLPALFYGSSADDGDAEPETTTISRYDADFTLDDDGDLAVVETLTVDFPGYGKHGIFRFWDKTDPSAPHARRTPHDVEVTRDGRDEPFSMETQGHDRFEVAKIGDADVEISPGEHVYTISYTVPGVLLPNDDAVTDATGPTMFYWNLIPSGWRQNIDQAHLTVHLPAPAQDDVRCAASVVDGGDCTVQGAGTRDLTVDTGRMYAGDPVTIATALDLPTPPEGGHLPWTGRWDRVLGTHVAVLVVVLLLAALATAYGARLGARSREKAPRYPLLYAPPAGIGPAQAKYVYSEEVDNETYVATLMHAAEKGAVDLDRQGSTWTIADKSGAEGWAGLDPVTVGVAHLLGGPGTSFTASPKDKEAGERLTTELSQFKDGVKEWGSSNRLVVPSGLGPFGWWLVAGAFVLVLVVLFANPFHLTLLGLVPGGFAVGAVSLLRTGAGTRRTRAGRELWSQVGGFRRILATPSSKERFDFSGRQELYTAYIPWAVALGCADEWAAKYRTEVGVEPPVPHYFAGAYAGTASSAYVNSMVDSFNTTVSSAISSYSQSQSSSSGGGGGFSGGGGGGGGGGGSW